MAASALSAIFPRLCKPGGLFKTVYTFNRHFVIGTFNTARSFGSNIGFHRTTCSQLPSCFRYTTCINQSVGYRNLFGLPSVQCPFSQKTFSSLAFNHLSQLAVCQAPAPVQKQPSRNVIKFSRDKGVRLSDEEVPKRFYRLQSGLWIRTIAGKDKKLWKKKHNRKHRIKQHVFCKPSQCRMLDKMVTAYWKKPKYYIDDIYEPYQERNNFVYHKKHWSKY